MEIGFSETGNFSFVPIRNFSGKSVCVRIAMLHTTNSLTNVSQPTKKSDASEAIGCVSHIKIVGIDFMTVHLLVVLSDLHSTLFIKHFHFDRQLITATTTKCPCIVHVGMFHGFSAHFWFARCKRCEKITNVDRTSHVYTQTHTPWPKRTISQIIVLI